MSVDSWESGNPYEYFMGRWSRPVAHIFLDWLSISDKQRWLDVGCGTGVLSSLILTKTTPLEILAIDTSDAFLSYAQQTYQNNSLRFQLGDASKLPADTGYFDVAVSGLALNFFPNPQVALSEMVRTIRKGGIIALYVWDYAAKMQMLRYFWDVVSELDPNTVNLDEGKRFSICQPAALKALFQEAGLKNIEVRALDVPTVFEDFNDYWLPFLGGQGPAPGYLMSLNDKQRKVLEERLRTILPFCADGTITLMARAWAIRGKV